MYLSSQLHGVVNRRIKVQATLCKKMRPYSKNNAKQKGVEVWLK
jgi:hypothetical protein